MGEEWKQTVKTAYQSRSMVKIKKRGRRAMAQIVQSLDQNIKSKAQQKYK